MLILSRYIVRSVIMATSLVVLMLLGVETFLGLSAELPEIGRVHYSFAKALCFVLLFDPLIIYRFFPIAALLGSLIGLGGLASSSQLVAMRASGFSILQVIFSVIKAALIMLVFVVLIGEALGPKLVNQAIALKQQALGQGNDNGAFLGVWLKQDNNFIHIDNIVSDDKIQGIIQYRFDANNKLDSIVNSVDAHTNNDLWEFGDSTLTEITPEAVQVKPIKNLSLKLKIKRKLIGLSKQSSDQELLSELFRNYRYRHQLGLSYANLELSFWQRIIAPFIVVVMICLSVPFIFGSLRDTSMGTRIMIGGIFGFIFYVVNQFSGRISLAMSLPPFWAAVVPLIVFSLVCLFLLWRVEER